MLIGLAVGVDYSLFYIRREREERAKGARQARGDRHRRRHLRPCGADLRPDRHGRHGRHAAHRQHDLREHGHRHDPRGRRRRHRLAHRAARHPRRARRQAREGPPAVHRPPSVPGPRVPHVGLADRPRHAPPDRRRRRRRRRARRAVDPGARHADQAARHRVLQQGVLGHPDVPEDPEGVPGRGRLRDGRRQGLRRHLAAGQEGHRRPEPVRRQRQPRPHGRDRERRARRLRRRRQGDGLDAPPARHHRAGRVQGHRQRGVRDRRGRRHGRLQPA